MINTGSIVTIGNERYQVTTTEQHQCACTVCDVPNCAYNKAMQEWRKQHNVTTCERIIGVNKYFKKVEDELHQ